MPYVSIQKKKKNNILGRVTRITAWIKKKWLNNAECTFLLFTAPVRNTSFRHVAYCSEIVNSTQFHLYRVRSPSVNDEPPRVIATRTTHTHTHGPPLRCSSRHGQVAGVFMGNRKPPSGRRGLWRGAVGETVVFNSFSPTVNISAFKSNRATATAVIS